eukprot:GHVN01064626.1.p1 GENE.GHVN01064626.1~~GHVN01064626.1.p1  ORF type:complete len:166 (-),score=17.23 GHVN01064626.1:630-1127(-)
MSSELKAKAQCLDEDFRADWDGLYREQVKMEVDRPEFTAVTPVHYGEDELLASREVRQPPNHRIATEETTCCFCGKKGHYKYGCAHPKEPCKNCSKKGHHESRCWVAKGGPLGPDISVQESRGQIVLTMRKGSSQSETLEFIFPEAEDAVGCHSRAQEQPEEGEV